MLMFSIAVSVRIILVCGCLDFTPAFAIDSYAGYFLSSLEDPTSFCRRYPDISEAIMQVQLTVRNDAGVMDADAEIFHYCMML